MQKNTFGTRGEIIAANYLKKKGYKIIARNYRNKIGEIDLIALDGEVLVFVEVKTRISKAFGDPLEAINLTKQEKIHRIATLFLMNNNLMEKPFRFDAISILGDSEEDIKHIEEAF